MNLFNFIHAEGMDLFWNDPMPKKSFSKNSIFAIHSQIGKAAYFEYVIVIITIECMRQTTGEFL